MLIWDVFYFKSGEVRLAGLGAQAGKFWDVDANRVVTLGDRVVEDFNVFTGLGRHAWQDTRSGLLLARTGVWILADLR